MKCEYCDGKGLVQIAPNVRGLNICPYCRGVGSIIETMRNSKEYPHEPCINAEDGCEEWAGCPCVYYKEESEGKTE